MQDPEFDIKLTKSATNRILAILELQPFKQVNDLIVTILNQANPQDAALQQQPMGPRAVK